MQPRPQGFSLKKWVEREKALCSSTHFLREKPWGWGCCHCKEQLDSNGNGAIKVNVISNGNRTEWGPIWFVIIEWLTNLDDRVAGVRFVQSLVWLQTELDDTRFSYQLITTLTKFFLFHENPASRTFFQIPFLVSKIRKLEKPTKVEKKPKAYKCKM